MSVGCSHTFWGIQGDRPMIADTDFLLISSTSYEFPVHRSTRFVWCYRWQLDKTTSVSFGLFRVSCRCNSTRFLLEEFLYFAKGDVYDYIFLWLIEDPCEKATKLFRLPGINSRTCSLWY